MALGARRAGAAVAIATALLALSDSAPAQPARRAAAARQAERASATAAHEAEQARAQAGQAGEEIAALDQKLENAAARGAEAETDAKQDVTSSLNFPLHWTSARESWDFLFDAAIACDLLAPRPDDGQHLHAMRRQQPHVLRRLPLRPPPPKWPACPKRRGRTCRPEPNHRRFPRTRRPLRRALRWATCSRRNI